MLSALAKKNYIKQALKFAFSGFSLVFIGMLIFILVHDVMIGESSETTAEYCTKYGFLASPDCW
jgi:hypothetical protein